MPKEYNALLIRHLDIQKIYVDFADSEGIYKALDVKRVSTIHTAKTQELSASLGIHLVGFVDREGSDINNKKACEISGYDYLGSSMLICKTDDKWNNLPLSEKELDKLYIYLTEGRIINNFDIEEDNLLVKRGIVPALPQFDIEPMIYNRKDVPTVFLFRYDLTKASDSQLESCGRALFGYSTVLLEDFVILDNDVKLSKDGKYYLNCLYEGSYYNVLIQVKEDSEDEYVMIKDPKAVIHRGFLGEMDEDNKEYGDDSSEEVMSGMTALDYDDEEDLELDTDENLEQAKYIIQMDVDLTSPDSKHKSKVEGRFVYPMAQKIIEPDSKPSIPLAGSFDVKSFSLEDRKVVLKGKDGKNITLELNDKVDVKVDFANDDGEIVNGMITFSLIRKMIGEYSSKKKVIIEDMLLASPSRTVMKKKKIAMKASFKGKQIKDGCLNTYQMYLVDKDAEYCVLSFDDVKYMDDYFYISVSKDEPNIIEMVGEEKNGSALMTLSKVYFKR